MVNEHHVCDVLKSNVMILTFWNRTWCFWRFGIERDVFDVLESNVMFIDVLWWVFITTRVEIMVILENAMILERHCDVNFDILIDQLWRFDVYFDVFSAVKSFYVIFYPKTSNSIIFPCGKSWKSRKCAIWWCQLWRFVINVEILMSYPCIFQILLQLFKTHPCILHISRKYRGVF